MHPRNHNLHVRRSLVAASVMTVLCCPPALAQEALVLEEIVVTATKRRAAAQDVPLSVQALSENALAERGIGDMTALAASVPGLSLADGGPAYRTLYIRGVASEYGSAGTTGVYIDDVFVQPGGIVQTIIEPLYFDLDRIEVLRGPQGTLFGGSSMGGTVRFITRQPQYDTFAAAAGSQASYTQDGGFNYEVDGLVNAPLASNRAALRIVGAYRDMDGYVDKLIGDFSDPGRQGAGPITRIEDVNDEQFSAARVQLAVQATDRFEIRPMLVYQKTQAHFGAFDTPPDEYDQRRSIAVEEPIEDELKLGNLTLDYAGERFAVLSSTSYSERDAFFKEDGSNGTEETVLPLFYGLPRDLFFNTTYHGLRLEKSLQEELRVSSVNEQGVKWVAGLYYDDYEQENGFDWVIPGFSEAAFAVPDDNFYHSRSWLERKQKALFGEVDWPLTERLTATVGLRWYEFETARQSFDRSGELNGGPLPDGPVLESSEDGVSPRVTLSYDLGNRLLYATASRGFRPGGPNSPIPGVSSGSTCVADYRSAGIGVTDEGEVDGFESDELWNYEVGAKLNSADSRFIVNTAVYRMEWNDLQSLYIAPCGFGATVNFGKARLTGVEIDYQLALTQALEVSGGVNYNEAEIAENVAELGASEGDPLQNAPEWGGSLNVRYGFPLLGGDGYALATARYVDESYRTSDYTNPAMFQESYTLIGARIGLERDSWQLSVFVDNLADERAGVFRFLSAFFEPASYQRMFPIRGRTMGVSFRKDF